MFIRPTSRTTPRASSEAMALLWDKMSRQQYRQLGEAAIRRGMSAKEYVGSLAARHGLLHWIEPEDRPLIRQQPEGNC
jgi:hypothetical protein